MSHPAPEKPTDAPLATLGLDGEAATAALAERVAGAVRGGEILLLSGELGAGKTAFARALIQSLQSRDGTPEDVPSPTFTLVQTYEAGGLEIWHADLYRLSDAGELAELGLDAAGPTAVVLVEWPERAAGLWPRDAIRLRFDHAGEDAREVSLRGVPTQAARRIAGAFGAG
ncbi:tRNA (adenosine(37)-N6)-threonylcarbamoyltransferase complex ATPase subunit type 1 TsaE [Rhodobacterales bacterium HKCCE2091]|nr:tRNA (adenosine(37)-N6)-threonylcarbamoyltransferase complex ATPase subunit type 1 TsaE [Rhodobacterales bacterium HKCCE2091]